jgi:tetratricopeptide (TPR) repeat protein
VLLSLSKLKASCFGENSPERQRTLKDLANAYELAGQYDRSESLFESFCHPGAIYKDVWAESSAHIALAKLYAVEGKYKLAAAQFKQPIRVYGMTAAQFWARLADLYIRAGLFNEAKESMRMATLHAPGDTFSSGGGSSSAPTVE